MRKRKVIHDMIVVKTDFSSSKSPDLPSCRPKRTKSSPTSSDEKKTEVDSRAFPHAHSLASKIRTTYENSDIGPLRLTSNLRRYISLSGLNHSDDSSTLLMISWRLQFHRIAHTINHSLSVDADSESTLDFFERLTLRDFISSPPMFSCLVPSLDPSLREMNTPNIANIYSEFINFVKNPWSAEPSPTSTSHLSDSCPSIHPFPLLLSVLTNIRSKKLCIATLKQHVREADPIQNIHLHRLKYVHSSSTRQKQFPTNTLGKLLVIDCPDHVRFPENKYHHISTETAYVIEPVGDEPQIHLLIIETRYTPTEDEEIKQQWLAHRSGREVHKHFKKWYGGAQIFNVFLKDEKLREHLSRLTTTLMNSVEKRESVERGEKCCAEGQMVDFGQVWVPGQGAYRQYRNFKNENDRSELVEEAEEAADVWIAVTFLQSVD